MCVVDHAHKRSGSQVCQTHCKVSVIDVERQVDEEVLAGPVCRHEEVLYGAVHVTTVMTSLG